MSTAADPVPVREGEILDGKYRVERVLGAGGMGVVVAATHMQLHTRVALKFLLPAAMQNPQVVERFVREARAASQIQSEHVARVIDVGTLPTGSPYMVMEYLEGGDLAQALEKRGTLPVADAVSYVLQACEAIAEAHALGIVHRDLKPANLFLAKRAGRGSVVKVLDFGISKTKDAASSGLTKTSTMMGSPYYMSPEQIMSSKDVDARTDVWALGIILYEALTGAPPFVADTMPEIVYLVTQRDPPPLLAKRPDAPAGLVEVVLRCLRRQQSERYANVGELAAALVPFGPARSEISLERISRVLGTYASVRAPPPTETDAGAGKAPPLRATASTFASSHPGAKTGTRKAPFVILSVVASAVLLIGVVVLWQRVVAGRNAVPAPDPSTASAAPPSATPSALASAAPQPSPPPPAVSVEAPPASAASTVAAPRPPPAAPRPHAPAPPPPPPNKGMGMGLKE
jgi:serine/threonine protein kinase